MTTIAIRRGNLRRCSVVWWALLALQLTARTDVAQGAMTNGDNHGGTIDGAGELDLWTFTANQGDALSISIGELGDVALFVPWIRLRAPDGTNIGSAKRSQSAQIDVTAPQTGASTGHSRERRHRPCRDQPVSADACTDTLGAFVVPAEDEGGTLTNGGNHRV